LYLQGRNGSRPYVFIGELKFKENWYDSSNITELVNTHVPRVGGDAVLVRTTKTTGLIETVKDEDHRRGAERRVVGFAGRRGSLITT
jgi:hypothetical protein